MPLPTLIYDFDGTLINSDEYLDTLFKTIHREFDFPDDLLDQIDELKQLGIKEIIKRFKISPFALLKIQRRVQQESFKLLPKYDWKTGMRDVLYQLRQHGVQQGILTSSPQDHVRVFLQQHNFNPFAFIYSSRNLFGKDAKLRSLLKKHHLSKAKTLYVGDETRDIEASHAVGLKVAAVSWGYNSKQALQSLHPTYLIDSPADLIQIVKTIE